MAPSAKQTTQKKTGQTRQRVWVIAAVIVLIATTAVITWLIASIAIKDTTGGTDATPRPDRGAVGFIPVLLVLAFTAVTGVLIFGGLAFNDAGIGNGGEALGMPEGSIRALIAMSLILIFAILSVYLFSESSKERLYVSPGLSREEIRLLQPGSIAMITPASPAPVAPGASPGEPVFDVTIRGTLDEASSTLAVQLLATVSTLVVAVAGFYFGTKAVTAAIAATRAGRATGDEERDDEEDETQEEEPQVGGTKGDIELISPKSPATLAADLDEVFAPLDIELRVEPDGAAVIGTITGDDDGKLETTAPDEFRYTPGPTPEDTVRLKFSLAVPFDASVELEVVQPPSGREGMI